MVTIWAIADLHLALGRDLSREHFAARWRDHAARIASAWSAAVGPDDLVLLPGDLSMARNHRELQPDLAWLARLPGTKVLAPGNHDNWWNSVKAVRPLLRRGQLAADGDAVATHGVIVCGSRSAPVPADPADTRSGQEELERLDAALAGAARLRRADQPLYVLWHYPPFDQFRRPGPVVARLEQAHVTACVYGHLHIEGQWSLAVQGTVGRVRYHCVAADAIGFRPLKIDAIEQSATPSD